MKRLERLIREMRKQLLPYHHEHDIERGGQRWDVGTGEYLTSWIASLLKSCHDKNRCSKRGKCSFYGYSDLAKRNYEICHEILLRIENGEIRCLFEGGENEKDGANT